MHMPIGRLLFFSVAAVVVGCSGSQAAATGESSTRPTNYVRLQPATVEGLVGDDRVSAGDLPTPDGRRDAVFSVQVRGPIANLILTVCDDIGTHTSTQWDTIVGQDPMPHRFI